MPLALLTALFAVAGSTPPRAELVFVRLAGAEACEKEALEDAVATRLGYAPFVAAAPVRVRVEVSGKATLGARLFIERPETATAERSLAGPADCRALTESLALSIALALDPLVLTRPRSEGASLPTPTPVAPAAASPAPEPVSPGPDSPPAEPERHLHLHGTAGVDLGTQPQGPWALELGARLSGEVLGLEVGPWLVLPARHALSSGGFVDVFSAGAFVGACAARGRLGGCAAVRGGALQYEAVGLSDPQRGFAWALSLGPRAFAEWPLGASFSLRVVAELWIPLLRALMYVNAQRVWTQPALAGGVQVGATFEVF